jgi:hypothetical protein
VEYKDAEFKEQLKDRECKVDEHVDRETGLILGVPLEGFQDLRRFFHKHAGNGIFIAPFTQWENTACQ